jgi:hypothetical protein
MAIPSKWPYKIEGGVYKARALKKESIKEIPKQQMQKAHSQEQVLL